MQQICIQLVQRRMYRRFQMPWPVCDLRKMFNFEGDIQHPGTEKVTGHFMYSVLEQLPLSYDPLGCSRCTRVVGETRLSVQDGISSTWG